VGINRLDRSKRVVFTGGGTAGHVLPNLVLAEALGSEYDLRYIGSNKGPERDWVAKTDIPFIGIASGKWRRYFSLQNVSDLFCIAWGCLQSLYYLWKLKPDLVISKGGYVTVPVLWAASVLRVPSMIHESDWSPGLANRLASRWAGRILTAFDETRQHFAKESRHVGLPLRAAIMPGNMTKEAAKAALGIQTDLPILLVLGGGLGSRYLNEVLDMIREDLVDQYYLIHCVGKGQLPKQASAKNYQAHEFLSEFPVALTAADLVLSRSGASTVFELIASQTPHIFIPLSKAASRGDQIENAKYFESKGLSLVLDEEDLNASKLLHCIQELSKQASHFETRLAHYAMPNGTAAFLKEIQDFLAKT